MLGAAIYLRRPGVRRDDGKLLPVIDQDLRAGLAEAGAVLLQTGQHGLVAVIHHGPAMARNVARAGVMALLLRRRRGSHHNERNDEKKSGHGASPHTQSGAIKFRRSIDVNASEMREQPAAGQTARHFRESLCESRMT